MSIFMVKKLHRWQGDDPLGATAQVYVRDLAGAMHFVRELKGRLGQYYESNYTFESNVPPGALVIKADADVIVDVVRLN